MTLHSTPRPTQVSGFSLIEVTLAIGIIAFALMAVIALLPIGLRSVKSATERAGAAAVLESISTALRHSATETPGEFKIISASGTNTFSGPTNFVWNDLTLEGEEDALAKRLAARVDILAIPTATNAGRAVVSVAWSAASNPEWNSDTQQWSRSEGFLTSGLLFHLPTDPTP